MEYLKQIAKRRSIYSLGRKINLSHDELAEVIKTAVELSPSAFNSQSSRALILFGSEHERLWDLALEAVAKTTEDGKAPEQTIQKINSCFKSGIATVLFFEDQEVIKGLQAKYAAYADKFPEWSEHSSAIAQFNV